MGAQYGEPEEIGSGTLIAWDKAKTVTGAYQGVSVVPSKYGKGPDKTQRKYAVEVKESTGAPELQVGARAEFFAPAILDRKLQDAQLNAGDLITITYAATTIQTDNGTAKDFGLTVRRLVRHG